ncbi:hypothetical protein [Mycoplasma todarodis]|uniref:hypothetical protein n=1 Tax=Mycoplasma todarodis TaxID=1937191 RepID=UPI003B34BE88
MKITNFKNKFNYKYFIPFVFMVYVIIFAFCDTYLIPFKTISGPAGAGLEPGTKPGIAQVYGFWEPWDKLSLIFYFTIHSNIFVMVYMFLRAFGLIDPRKGKHAKRFQMIVATNIFVTFLVYWTILAPIDMIWHTPAKIIDNLQLHFIAPLIMFVAFVLETSRRKVNKENIKLPYKELLFALIFPLIWLIMAIVLYYATRSKLLITFKYNDGTKHAFIYTFGIAIYPFLAFDIVPVWLPIVSLVAVCLLVTIVSSLIVVASNHDSWIYKVNDKIKNIFKRQ